MYEAFNATPFVSSAAGWKRPAAGTTLVKTVTVLEMILVKAPPLAETSVPMWWM